MSVNELFNGTPPVDFQSINVYNSLIDPSTVHVNNTAVMNMLRRYLFQRVFAVYDFNGIPNTWDKDYFRYVLFVFGFEAIVKTDKFGVIPQYCTLDGRRNVFMQPSRVLIANPLIRGNVNPAIGSECALIKMQPNYSGIWDLVSYYASMMAVTLETAAINTWNSKFSWVFAGDNKAEAETMKKMFDQIGNQPAVFVSRNMFDEEGNPKWQMFNQNVRENFIGLDLQEAFTKWNNQFDTFIGIENANYEKSERLNVDEVNANNGETRALCAVWRDCINEGLQTANKLFDLNLSVKLRQETRSEPIEQEENEDVID